VYNQILKNPLGEPDKRNFLAHSGFERNVVEVRKDGKILFLRYTGEKIKTIVSLCQSGLK